MDPDKIIGRLREQVGNVNPLFAVDIDVKRFPALEGDRLAVRYGRHITPQIIGVIIHGIPWIEVTSEFIKALPPRRAAGPVPTQKPFADQSRMIPGLL